MQFAKDNISDADDVSEIFENSDFLKDFRSMVSSSSRGCILMDSPERLKYFLKAKVARDSTGRGVAYTELANMRICPSHGLPGKEIPEKHWAYKFSKKHWFFGFGAYG